MGKDVTCVWMLENLHLSNSIVQKILVLLIWKWMGLYWMRNHLVRFWNYFSLLNWIHVITLPLLLKILCDKIWALICSMKFLSSEAMLYLHKCHIKPCMECNGKVWTSASDCFLNMLDMLKKWVSKAVGSTLTACLEPFA